MTAILDDAGDIQIAPEHQDGAEARRILMQEADALRLMADGIGQAFSRAVGLILQRRGRVVVSGIGKSGHIGRKIAATLASTGTRALFLHPAEAGHGDLGMIDAAEDVVIGISKSGNTTEFAPVIAFARRFAVPLIAITGDGESQLAAAAEVALLLPQVPEACPLNLAPMTSSTATLALGDALAAALMRRRRFDATRFRDYHPGGQLGSVLLRVADIMHRGPRLPLVALGTLVRDAIVEMTGKRLGCVGVVDEAGALVGVFTDGDLRRALNPDLFTQPVETVMVRHPRGMRSDALVADLLQAIETFAIPSVFILDEGRRPLGIVHLHDLVRNRIL
jgi:arabinose-5-phosphate isomerase